MGKNCVNAPKRTISLTLIAAP